MEWIYIRARQEYTTTSRTFFISLGSSSHGDSCGHSSRRSSHIRSCGSRSCNSRRSNHRSRGSTCISSRNICRRFSSTRGSA